MKRVELFRNEHDLEVADIAGDIVIFRDFEFGHPEFEEPFERSAYSMPLEHLRKVVKAADE